MRTKYELGGLQAFGPISLIQRQSGRWAVQWLIEWEFQDKLDAVKLMGQLMGFEAATANYEVNVNISPERIRRQRKSSPA